MQHNLCVIDIFDNNGPLKQNSWLDHWDFVYENLDPFCVVLGIFFEEKDHPTIYVPISVIAYPYYTSKQTICKRKKSPAGQNHTELTTSRPKL